jgi:hypothetical protein
VKVACNGQGKAADEAGANGDELIHEKSKTVKTFSGEGARAGTHT